MAIDIIGITLVIIFFIRGYMKGIIVAAFSLLAIVLGIICSLKLSQELAAWLSEKGIITSGWAQIISFVVLFIAILFGVRLVAKALETSARAMMLGWVNSGIGGLLYAFMAAVIWSSLLWLATQMSILSPEIIAESKTYKYVEPLAPWTFEKIGAIWPMVKDIFSDLQQYFSGANKPGHVDTAR
jgi:membrane protein required for colicin V production